MKTYKLFTLKKYPENFNKKDTLSNIIIFILPFFIKKFSYLINWLWFTNIYYFVHAIGLKASPEILTWPWIFVLFLGQDFMFYWFHRTSHHVRWFWASHITHHSSKYLNLSTALRHNILSPLIGLWIFWLPISFLGFSLAQLELTVFLNITYQFFVHTPCVKNMPNWVNAIFCTPSHHRVHHGTNEKYLNKNFGSVLIIWDRFFGTFQKEEERPIYGVLKPVNFKNIYHANFDEYLNLIKDLFRKKSLKSFINTFIKIN